MAQECGGGEISLRFNSNFCTTTTMEPILRNPLPNPDMPTSCQLDSVQVTIAMVDHLRGGDSCTAIILRGRPDFGDLLPSGMTPERITRKNPTPLVIGSALFVMLVIVSVIAWGLRAPQQPKPYPDAHTPITTSPNPFAGVKGDSGEED